MNKQSLFLFIEHYGYFGLFGILIMGLIGVPIPDEVLLSFVGFLVYKNKMNYALSFITAFLGSVVGMSFSYWIGNKLGKSFIRRHGHKINLHIDRVEKIERWFERYEGIFITFGYFVPGVRHVSAIVAGFMKLSYRRFLFFACTGAVIWVGTFLSIGYFVGEKWEEFDSLIRRHIVVGGVVLIVIALIIYGAWIRYNNRKKNSIKQ